MRHSIEYLRRNHPDLVVINEVFNGNQKVTICYWNRLGVNTYLDAQAYYYY